MHQMEMVAVWDRRLVINYDLSSQVIWALMISIYLNSIKFRLQDKFNPSQWCGEMGSRSKKLYPFLFLPTHYLIDCYIRDDHFYFVLYEHFKHKCLVLYILPHPILQFIILKNWPNRYLLIKVLLSQFFISWIVKLS